MISDKNKKCKIPGKSKFETPLVAGRYPIWNVCGHEDIQLEDLTFEPDMRVILKNNTKRVFRDPYPIDIASFSVPLNSMLQRKINSKPQFFNLINEEQQFMGQILCNFWLAPSQDKYIKKDHKRRNKDMDRRFAQIYSELKQGSDPLCKVNIKMAVLGIRNLIHKGTSPKIIVKITNDKGEPKELKMNSVYENDVLN